jgi:lipopolysaccharide biosynthesis glycosyltransferase
MSKTVVVTLTDSKYYQRAKRTIIDTRTRGLWNGDLVLITIDFDPSSNFLDYYQIINKKFEHIDISHIIQQYDKFPLKTIQDNRHILKLAQWNKFYVFDEFFSQWDKVIFLDAGLRVFDSIKYLLDLDCDGKLLAPDDAATDDSLKRFHLMLEMTANPSVSKKLLEEYGEEILNKRYFLNCIWMYDTKLLKICNKDNLIIEMNKYPICRTNEMTIMNLLFTMKHKVWKPFPEFVSNNKILFAWTENDRYRNKTWRNFCFIKYPFSINFDCD